MKLSIVVPCYNEEKNIPLLLNRFSEIIKRDDIEVVLVNNGSTDGSADVIQKLLPLYTFARTVLVPKNQGYGYGVIQGLSACKGEYIGWTHADLQTDPSDIVKALDLIESNGDGLNLFLKGNRKGRPFFDVFFTIGMSLFESLLLCRVLKDINAQPNIFPRNFFMSWQDIPYDFSLDLYALYMAKISKLKIVRFAVLFPERVHGSSSWNTGLKAKWKFIKRTVSFSIQLRKRGIR